MAHALRALPIRSASKTTLQKASPVAKPTSSTIPVDYREAKRIVNPPPASEEKLSLPRFLANYHEHFPVSVRVCKGFCGMNEEKSISEGDRFNVHFVKYTTVVAVEFENGNRCNVPLNSAVPFALLYDPHNNYSDALKGYRFEKVGDLLQTSKLPLVVRARKAYQSSNSDNSIVANELLYLKKPKKAKILGKQHLKVFSLTAGREKSLSEACLGNFSTKPKDICLFLPEILKNMPDIFPCKAVLFNNPHSEAASSMPSSHKAVSLVTMMHSSIETSLVATSALDDRAENARMLDLPIELDILVRVVPTDEQETQQLYEDTTFLYNNFNPAKLHPYVNSHASRGVIERQAQLYTNVKPDCSGVDLTRPAQLIEEGHYQAPRSVRTPSDPIPIESVYHPPDPASSPQDQNSPSSRSKFYRSLSTPNAANDKVLPPNQLSLSSPGTTGPPLPPRHPRKRTPGYDYVTTNPRTTRPVLSEMPRRSASSSQCTHPSSSSTPDSANSENSFGSTGSGGAVVERRNSAAASFVHSTRLPPHKGGSGDGIVEGILRNRSVSPVERRNPSSSPAANSTNTSSDSLNSTNAYPDPASARAGITKRPVSTHERSSSLGAIRPDSMIFNSVLDDLDQLKQQLDDLVVQHSSKEDMNIGNSNNFKKEYSPAGFSTGNSGDMLGSDDGSLDAETCGVPEPPTAVSSEVIESNRKHLATMDTFQVLKLLETMGLEQYYSTFHVQQINGDILSECDEDILKNELQISSRLHRMRLLRVITGQYSVLDIMSGKDGYVFMLPAHAR